MTTEQLRQMGLGRDIIQELLASLQRMRMKEVRDTEVELLADTGSVASAQVIQLNGRTFKATSGSELASTDAADVAWAELKAAATAAGMTPDQLAAYVKQATQQIQQSSTTTTTKSGNGYKLGNFGLSTEDMFNGVQQSLQRTGGRGYNNH